MRKLVTAVLALLSVGVPIGALMAWLPALWGPLSIALCLLALLILAGVWLEETPPTPIPVEQRVIEVNEIEEDRVEEQAPSMG